MMHSILVSMLLFFSPTSCQTPEALEETPTDLIGVWVAKKSFGPDVRGELTLTLAQDGWQGHIAGLSVKATTQENHIRFQLPDDRGRFEGFFHEEEESIDGFWTQPAPIQIGLAVTSPVRLARIGEDRWQGVVVPRESEYTFYISLRERADGSVGGFIRNPDRNLGVFINLDRVVRVGDTLQFIGMSGGRTEERVMFEGVDREKGDSFSATLSYRGGTYEFERVTDLQSSPFFARGQSPAPYVYSEPTALEDGWDTGSLNDVDMSVAPLRAMIENEICKPTQDVHAHYVHGVLIARYGQLVFEEYFHGFDRDTPHDTRSASKSVASLLVGAAMESGESISPSSPVYRTILGDGVPSNLDPLKSSMTLEHLMTMSSGFHCDDNDSGAPGNEGTLQSQQDQPDWYRFTLDLPMISEPGDEAVYCSINSNLVGGVLKAATGKSLHALFERLIARPLQIERYYLTLQPTGEPYFGGGFHWLPRDFMKIGQVMIQGGTWKDHRVVSTEWVERSTTPLYDLQGKGYGYLWWVVDYPYQDGTVQAFFAGGNGGQLVVGVPELDLVVAFFGGNYSDPVFFRSQEVLVPEYILRAVGVDEG